MNIALSRLVFASLVASAITLSLAADVASDFKAAASFANSKGQGCGTIPYASDQQLCDRQRVDELCKTDGFACDATEATQLARAMKTQQANLAALKGRTPKDAAAEARVEGESRAARSAARPGACPRCPAHATLG